MNIPRHNLIPTYPTLEKGVLQRQLNSKNFLFIVDGLIYNDELKVIEVDFDYETNHDYPVFIEIYESVHEGVFLYDNELNIVYYYE